LTESACGPKSGLPQDSNDTGEGAEQAGISSTNYEG
jgi:hypothetical protein